MTIRLPEFRCPHCGHQMDAASDTNAPDESIMPRAGDFTVCITCAGIMVFTLNGAVRKPTKQELEEAKADPRISRVRFAIRMMQQRN